MKITGSVALVTGANGGLGEAIALRLQDEGAELVLTGRRRDAIEPLAKKLGGRMVIADLARREDVRRSWMKPGPSISSSRTPPSPRAVARRDG